MKIKYTVILIISLCLLLALSLSLPFVFVKGYEADSTPVDVSQGASRGRVNILVAGTDRASGLTDVIMLISFDRDAHKLYVMQLPRDTYAEYAESGYKKLNGAYGALGGKGLCDFLSDTLSVSIDGYVVLSPDAVRGAVDALGGVDVELLEPMYYTDPYQGLTISLPKGRHTLDGAAAEQFIRYRSGYANGDIGRIDAQKVFMTAVLKKARGLSPIAIAKLASSMLGKMDTDIGLSDIGVLSREFGALDEQDVLFLTAPGAPVTSGSGASFYSLSGKAMNEVISGYFGGEKDAFDRKKLFLNENNPNFREIYDGYCEYHLYGGDELSSDGLGKALAP